MEQMLSKGLEEKFNAAMAYKEASVHGSSDSGNISGEENKEIDFNDVKQQVQSTIRAGSKRTPMEIEEAIMRKKLRNRESAQRARSPRLLFTARARASAPPKKELRIKKASPL